MELLWEHGDLRLTRACHDADEQESVTSKWRKTFRKPIFELSPKVEDLFRGRLRFGAYGRRRDRVGTTLSKMPRPDSVEALAEDSFS
jgi:hypothetical protein